MLKDFQAVEDKFSAITSTGVSDALADMIKRHIAPGQKLAVENEDYKNAIENSLVSVKLPCVLNSMNNFEQRLFPFQKISCLYDPTVEELIWGLKIQVPYLVPAENPKVVKLDLFPMNEGMKSVLNFHSFNVKPDMMVSQSPPFPVSYIEVLSAFLFLTHAIMFLEFYHYMFSCNTPG